MTLVNRRTIKCDEPGCPATFTLLRAYFASKGRRSGMIRARARGTQHWTADREKDRCRNHSGSGPTAGAAD